MKRLTKCLVLTMAILGTVAPAVASDKGLIDLETFSSFQFNFNNPGARSLGMGGAFVAVADDATAVIANPAGLPILQRPELSAEVKFTKFRNTIPAFSNTPADAPGQNYQPRTFDDTVTTPSFFSFVYPTERLTVAAFVREQINYKSTFETNGVFLTDPTNGTLQRFLPVKSELEITSLNFGFGAGLNLKKENPLLPNIGASIEFSIGSMKARLNRYSLFGPTGPPDFNTVLNTSTGDGTDIGIGFNVGALWHPLKDLGVGVVYRRGPQYDFNFNVVQPSGGPSF